ncbi:MAG TPA: CoA transferase, partial [Polyangiales bacterium]
MGPLHGLKVVELVGLGPGPFAAMLLSDMGAQVIRIDRADRVRQLSPQLAQTPSLDLLARGRPNVGVDLKHPEGVVCVLRQTLHRWKASREVVMGVVRMGGALALLSMAALAGLGACSAAHTTAGAAAAVGSKAGTACAPENVTQSCSCADQANAPGRQVCTNGKWLACQCAALTSTGP